MSLNVEDADIINAERDASPKEFQDFDPSNHFSQTYSNLHPERREETSRPQVERHESTASSHSSLTHSTSSGSSVHAEAIRTDESAQRPEMADRQPTQSLKPTDTQVAKYLERHPTAVERVATHRLQHEYTVGSTVRPRKSAKPLPPFGSNKPYPPPLPEREEFVVEFDGNDDPLHAQNWSGKTKIIVSMVLIFNSLGATYSSSIFSTAATAVGAEFHVGNEVTTLGTSLFVLGYAFGPIVWAPMSELYGRRLPIIIAAFAFGIFNIAVAVAKDLQTLMICRFFAGFFGSSPLTVVAAVFADMYDNKHRGLAVACFSATVFMGPLMGPFTGGFITNSYLGWRWTAYIPAFMGFAACIGALFLQKETYAPVILVEKAAELRRITRNWGIHAKQEEVEVDLRELLTKNISRPLRILFTEPIVLLVTIYMSFLYGLLYLFLTAYDIVFQQIYHMTPGVAGLPYFGFIVGIAIGFISVVLLNPGYVKRLEANNNIPVPEWRLPIVMAGGISFTIGLFWFGWTGYTGRIHWIVPTLSGLASGFGIFTVFLQLLNYIIDAYLMFAASAIAGNTIMRSLFAAVFPLFATYMFKALGVNFGMTLLGCVAALMIPLPFVFYLYGKKIRARSKFAPAPDIEQDKRRDVESRGQLHRDDSAQTYSEEKKEE